MVKPLQTDVGHQRGPDVQRFERRDSGDVFESRIASLGAVQVQALQFFPVFDGRHAFVGDVLGEIEIEIGDAAQVLDLLHTLIGDVRERKIKISQIGILVEAAEVGIADPGSAQAHSGDAALRVARSPIHLSR